MRGRAPLLATVAVLGLLAGGTAVSLATETPAAGQRQACGRTTIVNTGYADLVAAVKPAVVNVRVERTDDAEGDRAGPAMADPEMRRFFERFFGEPGQGQRPDGACRSSPSSASAARARASSSAPTA